MRTIGLARHPRRIRSVVAVLATALGTLVWVAAPAEALTTINVTTTADGADCASAPAGSLRAAVCTANASSDTVQINVPAGRYILTGGELPVGTQTGADISITGAGPLATFVDPNFASRAFNLDPGILGGVHVALSSLSVEHGDDSTFGGAGIIGGSGNQAQIDTLSLSNVRLGLNRANEADPNVTNNPGGGLQFVGGNLTITNSSFESNTSRSSPGSAVAFKASGTAAGQGLTVSGSSFSANVATSSAGLANGGALDIQVQGGLTAPISVTNSTFTGNSVLATSGEPHGAGVYLHSGTGTFTGNTFTNNSVTGGTNASGAAFYAAGGTATLHYNRIVSNTAATGSGLAVGSAAVNATHNWWGCNSGPGTAGCQTIGGTATFSPWLKVTASASPTSVNFPDGTTTVTGSLLLDSSGFAVAPANLGAFEGLPVTFTNPLPAGATISPGSVNLASGTASATYNSHNATGTGQVTTTFDGATATADIIINGPPSITSANSTTFTVGTAGSFTVTTDATPVAAVSRTGTLPTGVTFVDNGDGTATLSGTPAAGTAGIYSLTITANNGIAPNAVQNFTLTVNGPPSITSANHAEFVVGDAGTFSVTTSGFPPTSSITLTGTLPLGVSFTDNGNGTATLAGTPGSGTAGAYPVTLQASNGTGTNATQTFTLTVYETPAVTTQPTSQHVAAGASVSFTAAASGSPAPSVQWQVSTDGGTNFSDVLGATSTTLTFNAQNSDNGNQYRAVFTNPAGTATSVAVTLLVGFGPQITSANATTFTVGAAGTFTVTVNSTPNATISQTGALPAGVTFTDNGDNTATISGTPAVGTGGAYPITIGATNGTPPDASQLFTLTVNESPRITSPDAVTFTAGVDSSFTISSVHGYPVSYSFSVGGTPPPGMDIDPGSPAPDFSFVVHGTPTTPGTYLIDVIASNSVTPDAIQTLTITVNPAPPLTFTSADTTTFGEGEPGTFTVTAPSPRPVTYSLASGALAPGVSLTSAGILSGTPSAGSEGTYNFTIAADDGIATGTQAFTLVVTPAPPIAFTNANSTTFTEGVAGTFTFTTSSPHTVTFSLLTGALAPGTSLTSAGVLSGTPSAASAGVYTFTVGADDGFSTGTQTFTLNVDPAPPIVFTNADSDTWTKDVANSFTFTTTGGYPAVDAFSLQSGVLPPGVSLSSAGVLSGTPTVAGEYHFTVRASNGVASADQLFTLTVQGAPTITSADTVTFTVGTSGSFSVITSGGVPTPTISASGGLPTGVSFTDNGDGTGSLSGTPAPGTGGAYALTLTAANGVGSAATQAFTLVVHESTAITSVDTATFEVGVAGSFAITTAGGFPTTIAITEGGALPNGLTFTDNGDGTATLAGTAAASAVGDHVLTITADNGVSPAATQSLTVHVESGHVDLPPTLPPSSGKLKGVPATTRPGQVIHVSGKGFAAGAAVVFGIYSSPTPLGSTVADSSGAIKADLTIPTTLSGSHTVVAGGVGANGEVRWLTGRTTIRLETDVPGRRGTEALPTTDQLPATGLSQSPWRTGGYAVVALIAGFALIRSARRRARLR